MHVDEISVPREKRGCFMSWLPVSVFTASSGKVASQATNNSYQSGYESKGNHRRAFGSDPAAKAYPGGIARPRYTAIARIHLESAILAELMVEYRILEVFLAEQAQSWKIMPFQ